MCCLSGVATDMVISFNGDLVVAALMMSDACWTEVISTLLTLRRVECLRRFIQFLILLAALPSLHPVMVTFYPNL